MLAKFLKDMFTEKDGQTFDLGRLLWFQAIQVFLMISIYAVIRNSSFDPVSFAGSLGGILLSGSGSLSLKKSTDSAKPPEKTDADAPPKEPTP